MHADENTKLLNEVKTTLKQNGIQYLCIDDHGDDLFALVVYNDYMQSNRQTIENVINTMDKIQSFDVESTGTIKDYLNTTTHHFKT